MANPEDEQPAPLLNNQNRTFIIWPENSLPSYPAPKLNIGVLHQRTNIGKRGEEIKIDFEDLKEKYMDALFSRLSSPPADPFETCMALVLPKVAQIRSCYKVDLSTMYDERIAIIMVLDACFILELIYKSWSREIVQLVSDSNDLLFIINLKRDLVFLQNQIPYFVLRDIYTITINRLYHAPSLVSLVLSFLSDINPFLEPNKVIELNDQPHVTYEHILDLVYRYHHPGPSIASAMNTTYSVIELGKAGVNFEPIPVPVPVPVAIENQAGVNLEQIPVPGDHLITFRFKSSWLVKHTLTMPQLRLEEHTRLLLWNLASYERHYPDVGSYIMSYAFAMMMLVDSKEDYLKLIESKIIRNMNGHQYFVDFLHGLFTDEVLKKFSYADEWTKMDNYCKGFQGSTRRIYFRSAWSYIVSLSALIIFILTGIQTYCAIRGLKHQSN